MRMREPEKEAIYAFLVRKHVQNDRDRELFDLWWMISGSEMYDQLMEPNVDDE